MAKVLLNDIIERSITIYNDSIKIFDCCSNGIDSFSTCYNNHSSLSLTFVLCIVFVLHCLVFSVISGNCSKVDQLWSITPIVYAWIFYFKDLKYEHVISLNSRLFWIVILITCWGVRLTYNFYRKGGYGNLITHEEDYRWEVLRKIINNKFLFFLFNVSFISFYQNVLLWLITAPLYEVSLETNSDINYIDVIVLAIGFILITIETMADEQQWQFQTLKYSYTEQQRKAHSNIDIQNGFLTKGLFSYSRHPNYACEQAIWICVYIYSTIRSGFFFNWTIIGVINLLLLFRGSIFFSEGITLSKYPNYKYYQLKVPICFPLNFSLKQDSAKDHSDKSK